MRRSGTSGRVHADEPEAVTGAEQMPVVRMDVREAFGAGRDKVQRIERPYEDGGLEPGERGLDVPEQRLGRSGQLPQTRLQIVREPG